MFMKTDTVKFIIPIPPVTKKNSSRIVKAKGRLMVLPSQKYEDYEKACEPFLVPLEIDCPITLECHYYMPTRRRVDLVNLLQATCDVLVKYKVITDDNCKVVVSHDGSRVHYDKDNPRTVVCITKFKE